MIMIVKTPGSQMGSPAAADEGGKEMGGGRWESGERSEVQSLEECLTSGRRGICGRSPERTPVATPSVSWHRRATSDLFEPDIGR